MAQDDATRAQQEIVAVAQRMLAGEWSFIEGARQIVALRDAAGLDHLDPDVLPFVVIDSETNTLPFGDVRELWAPAALEKPQPEIDRAEQWAREAARLHCENLINRLALEDEPATEDEPAIEDEDEFWLRLGRRISAQLRLSGDNNRRFLWVDGAVPNSILPKLDEAIILVRMFVSEDSGKSFVAYKVTVHLDEDGIESYRTGNWWKLLPHPEASGWLTVRRDAKEMDVRLSPAL